MLSTVLTALALSSCTVSLAKQYPLLSNVGSEDSDEYHHFSHEIRRVAVIGAGPSGLQAAAALVEEGLEVRLFERADQPAGNWYYRDEVPVDASFPNKPLVNSSYAPSIPKHLPHVRFYDDGEDGVSASWRISEHENPSPIWANLTTIAPPFIMTLPNTEYPATLPWRAPHRFVGRHVRQFAAAHSLSSNDEESAHIISYSTRVERVHKPEGSNKWILTLRKLERLPYSAKGEKGKGKIRAEWWTEEFDAVVAAAGSFDSPWVPPTIKNLDEWANARPERIYHSRKYRTPGEYAGKHVLIIGGGISSLGISNDLVNTAASVSVSVRNGTANPLARVAQTLLHPNVTRLPEIKSFSSPSVIHGDNGLLDLRLTLANGTRISGYDHIILATGYRRSHPFLADYHNSTIKGREEPETKVAPIITDGTHVRSLHWTGHYIADPTLAIARFIPWTLGQFAALGYARVWSGKARLPSIKKMWETYPGAGKELRDMHGFEEWYARLFITWLNDEALEFGGRFVDQLPRHHYDFAYFAAAEWGTDKFIDIDTLLSLEYTPRSKWPVRNGRENLGSDLFENNRYKVTLNEETWADWNLEW